MTQTTEIRLEADTFENMRAAYVAQIVPTLTAREQRAGRAQLSFVTHMRDVVTGKVTEAAPTDADRAAIVLAEDKIVIKRECGCYDETFIASPDKARAAIPDNEFAKGDKTYRLAADVTEVSNPLRTALVLLNGELTYVYLEAAYRNGLRLNEDTQIQPRTAKSAVTVQYEEKTAEARATSKFLGARALTGTAKQKAWGEQIRAEKLREMTEEQAAVACKHKLAKTAKFWIEQRYNTGAEIGSLLMDKNQEKKDQG